MEKPLIKMPVIFKKHYDRDVREWFVTAFFPTEPSSYDGSTMTCYAHVGQHGGASLDFFWLGKKCKPEEYADLLKELRGIYGEGDEQNYDLVVYQKMTPKMRDEFKSEVKRMRELR